MFHGAIIYLEFLAWKVRSSLPLFLVWIGLLKMVVSFYGKLIGETKIWNILFFPLIQPLLCLESQKCFLFGWREVMFTHDFFPKSPCQAFLSESMKWAWCLVRWEKNSPDSGGSDMKYMQPIVAAARRQLAGGTCHKMRSVQKQEFQEAGVTGKSPSTTKIESQRYSKWFLLCS